MTDAPVALVTGASRGIGLATARALAAQGYRLVLAASADSPALQQAAADLAPSLSEAPLLLPFDVADHAAVAAAIRQVFQHHRRLDLLVNNAGVMTQAPLGMLAPAQVERMLAVNAAGALHLLQAAARLMARNKRGCIVNVASVVAHQGSAGSVAYAASKAAVVGMTRSAARELGPQGIRVNAVAPGVVDTDLVAHLDADARARLVAATPLGRLGRADDVAAAICWLASDAAAFVTGQVLGVDGGLVLPG